MLFLALAVCSMNDNAMYLLQFNIYVVKQILLVYNLLCAIHDDVGDQCLVDQQQQARVVCTVIETQSASLCAGGAAPPHCRP